MTYDTEKWTGQHLVAPVASPQCHALSSVLYLLTPAFLFLNLLEIQVSHFFSAPRLSQKGSVVEKVKPGNTGVKGFGVLTLPRVCRD